MAWTQIIVLWIALVTTQAYKQRYFPPFPAPFGPYVYSPSIGRRADYRRDTQEVERTPNERSIPFRSSMQAVHSDVQGRNGNSSYKILNSYTKIHSSLNRRADPDSIVFPGPSSRQAFVPQIPKNCLDFGICEKIPNYPSEHVNQLISQVQDLYRFNLDRDVPEIAQRRGPGEEDIELCDHNETIIYPKAAKNIHGRWVIVINNEEKPVQGFKAEICVNVDKACSSLAYFPEKYNATCHQKMAERQMWSVSSAGEMVLENVLVPSCCTCIARIVS